MNRNQRRANVVFRIILLALAASYIYAMNSGVRNNYGIMLNSIVSNSGISFASVSFVLAVGQLVFGLVQPAFGILAAKRGNVFALVSGVVLMVAGMILMPFCKSILSLMICLGIILPAGTGAISYGVIMGTITPKLPPKSAPAVSGIVNASSGIGNTLLSPIVNALIKTEGLLNGMVILSIPAILMIPVAFMMGSTRKEIASEIGEAASLKDAGRDKVDIKGMFKTAVKSRMYLYLMIGFFTCGFHMALITNHLPNQFLSYQFTSEAAAYAFSVYGLTTIAGSILSGSLCAKFQMKNVLGFFYGLRPFTIFLFLVAPKSLVVITAFTAFLGFSGASTVPPVAGIINKAYGAGGLATLFGFVFFIHQIGGFFGAWLGGVCFTATGGYNAIWIASIVFSSVAALVSFAIDERHAGVPV